MSILGNRVVRTEDPRLLTAGGTYVDDIAVPGAAFVTYLRSPVAHARIRSIDIAGALDAPGVLAVVTAADLGMPAVAPALPMINQQMARPFLADGFVRFVGEPVAAVITEDRYQGPDAAEAVDVDYDLLPAVIDLEEALAGGTLLFPEAGTNVAMAMTGGEYGVEDDALFEGCEVVVRRRLVNQRLAPCPLEGRAAAAAWGDDGRLTHWASTQRAHGTRDEVAKLLALAPDQVRVICPDVGGGFGAKGQPYPEELLLGWLARRVGRPLRWVETRSESMLGLQHGRGQVQDIELGGRRDGTLLAYRLRILQDGGAYPRFGSFLPTRTRMMASGVYAIPRVECTGHTLVTNTVPTGPYRGAGRPEAAAAIERAVDLFAAEIGADPAEVRRRNLVPTDAFPFTTAIGTEYDSGDYVRALDLALETSGYAELRAEQARRRAADDPMLMGIGLAVYVEVTAGAPGGEYGSVAVGADGAVVVRTGSVSQGQGHETAWAMIIAERLGTDMDSVTVLHGDTDVVPRGVGTNGSRSLQVGGMAVYQAAGEVVDRARALAADLLEAAPGDVVLDAAEGRFHVAGTPVVYRTWADVVAAAGADGLSAEVQFMPVGPTFPFGAHVAIVDVDRETGLVHLRRIVAVDDAGRILNPVIAEGQVHGGLAQGIGQALFEEMVYDAEGNPLTTTFADYGIVSAAELPSFELVGMETPTPLNALGAKGIGEAGTIGATPAVNNAVVDALAHLGVRHVDLPATPERVWRAIQGAS